MSTPGFKDRSAPRSPIRVKPRRQAGHSLRRTLFEERDAYLFYAAGGIMGVLGMLGATWLHWWRSPAASPWLPTVVGALIVLALVFAGWRRLVALRSVEQGLEGEITVGQTLERLRRLGYEVLHDVPGGLQGSNIDHVLIGPGGVFVIETKTWSKVGDQKITYDGQRITVDGHDRSKPLGQARACRDDVRKRLTERFPGKEIPVRAIVVFAGWYIHSPKGRSGPDDVWVLNEGGVEKWIAKEDERLPDEAVPQIAAVLHM